MENKDKEQKDLHQNSDYPLHHPNKGTVEPTILGGCCNCFKKFWKKLFG